jgi:hypothetical protein
MTGMTREEVDAVAERLRAAGADHVERHDGREFTARESFFYTGGRDAEHFARRVVAAVPGAVVLGSGEVWKAFRGGDSVKQGSHWWVRFRIPKGGAL